MAKRRKSIKSRTRTVYKTVKRKAKKRYAYGKVNLFQPESIGYGMARGKINSFARNLVGGNIPLDMAGAYGDNVLMGAISYFAAKKGKGLVKKAGLAGLQSENFLVGLELGSDLMKGSSNSGANQSAGFY